MKKTEFLGPRETFEFYEKRAHSPLNYARPDTAPSPPQPLSTLEMQPTSRVEYIPATYAYVPVEQQKRKVPLGWLIGLAVVVPIFVILMLFLAVWLQEMGII